jgi:glycosyltransferase involved in cell wall biosynthesis
MKIAFIHQPINTMSVTNQGGSIEIWIYEVARRLARNHDVIVYAKKGLNQKEFESHQGVQYKRISATAIDELFAYMSRGVDRRLLRIPKFKRPLFASSLYYLFYALRVAKDLRSEKCDVVHIHTFSQFVPIIRAFNPEIKIVLHMHCEWLTQLDLTMIKRRIREANLIIGCSQYITEKIRRCFPELADRCQTLYNGVDINTFVPENTIGARRKDDIKSLLFVGRVSPEKGVHILIDAFNKVAKHYPAIELNIVGPKGLLPIEFNVALSEDPEILDFLQFYSGNYISYLKSKLSPSVANSVSFAGLVSRHQLIKFYQNASVFVFPSVWNEPFGMPIIEAMAAGLPVVATVSGGITEIVKNGETGLLVERGDASALAEAILRFLSDEDLRNSMAKASRKRAVELFSWECVVDNLLHLYRNICEDNE